MPLPKTKVDLRHGFKGVMGSKVLGLPLPVVAVGGGVVGYILYKRRAGASADGGNASDAGSGTAPATAGGGYDGGYSGGGGAGGGAYGGGVPVIIQIVTGKGRRGRITGRPAKTGLVSKTVQTRKNRQGDTIRTVIRRWASGGIVTRRHVVGSGAGARVTRSSSGPSGRTVSTTTTRRRRPPATKKNPRPQSVPMTHFGG